MSIKIKWASVYYPLGEWRDESGSKVKVNNGRNFKCKYKDKDLLVIMASESSRGGHGDPGLSALTPNYIDADTLDDITIDDGDFLEFTESE